MTGLPAVYRPLNLHNEQPSDLSVHKHFQRFKTFLRHIWFFHTFHFALLWEGGGSLEMALEVESRHSAPTDVPAVPLGLYPVILQTPYL